MGKLIELRDAINPTPGLAAGMPIRESSRHVKARDLFGSGGKPGEIESAFKTAPRASAGRFEIERAASNAPLLVADPEDATPAEASFAESCRTAVVNCISDYVNNVGGWHKVKAQSCNALWFGGAIWEISRTPTGEIELYHVHPSSWQTFTFGEMDRFVSLMQAGESGTAEILAENLIVITHGEGWPIGESIFRPMMYFWTLTKQVVAAYSRRAEGEAGVTTFTEPNATADDDAAEAMRASIVDWNNGRTKIIKLMEGWEISHLMPAAGSDPTVWLRWMDEQWDQLLNRQLSSLGGDGASGSRAVGETQQGQADIVWVNTLNAIGRDLGRQIFGWLAKEAGYTGRLPALEVEQGEEELDLSGLVTTLVAAKTGGLLTWSIEDELALRERIPIIPDTLKEAEAAGFDPNKTLYPLVAAVGSNLIGATDDLEDWLLEGFGAPARNPAAVPRALPGAAGPDPGFSASDRSHQCGRQHGARALELADGNDDDDAEGYLVSGADGREFRFWRPLTDLERAITLVDNEDARIALDKALEARIASVADDIRDDVFGIGDPDKLTQAAEDRAIADVRARWVERMRGIVDEHVEAVRDLGAKQAEGERERLGAQPGGIDPADSPAFKQYVVKLRRRTEGDAAQGAELMVSRVISEARQQWRQGIGRRTFTSALTASTLAGNAATAANRAESTSRSEAAVAVPGLKIRAIYRTSINDGNRCSICRARDSNHPDGRHWEFRTEADVAKFAADAFAQTPDPDCLGNKASGRNRCRCGVLIVYGE